MGRIKITGIYLITSPTGRKYVGQSVDIDKRFWGYKAMNGSKKQFRLHQSFLKYGTESHEFSIIEECAADELNERERHWQDLHDVCSKDGLNCRLTSSSDKTPLLSDDTIKKMSDSAKIRMSRMLKTPEFKESMRLAGIKRTGRKLYPHTDQTKEKLKQIGLLSGRFKRDRNPMFNSGRFGEKNPFYGKKHTKESRMKISHKAKGRKSSEETLKLYTKQRSGGLNSAAKLCLNMENGIFYDCGKDAWEAWGGIYTYSNFKSKLNGNSRYTTSYKYI